MNQGKPRVAICLTGEPRGIESCFDSLLKNVIEPLSASVFYSFNRATQEDEKKIKVIDKYAEFGELKEKCDLRKTLCPDSLFNKLEPVDFTGQSNWVGTINSQRGGVCYRHWDFKKISEIIKDKILNFDYFIITRTDFRYLFPIFDFSILKDQEIVKHKGFDNYSHTGMNWEFIIASQSKVLEFLESPFRFMNQEELQDIIIDKIKNRPRNNESFQRIIAEFYEWKITEMDINSFISADSVSEKTTWGTIHKCSQSGYHYKYSEMFFTALENCSKYNQSKKWIKDDSTIKIV